MTAESLWILDTSVVAAWFFLDEPHRPKALEVRAHLRDAPERYIVPPLFTQSSSMY